MNKSFFLFFSLCLFFGKIIFLKIISKFFKGFTKNVYTLKCVQCEGPCKDSEVSTDCAVPNMNTVNYSNRKKIIKIFF